LTDQEFDAIDQVSARVPARVLNNPCVMIATL
jgi:hypothetical protein